MKRLLPGVWLAGIAAFVAIVAVLPASSATATTATISRSYASTQPIDPGNIVSLTSLNSKSVTLANTTNSDKIIGVAVAEDGSIIAVDPDRSKVQIVTSGMADVLVSDLNGDIKAGDKVAVSPFDGIGMKSGSGERIVGLAQSGFTADSDSLTTKEVTDKSGNTRTLRIGQLPISVLIGDDDGVDGQKLNSLQTYVRSLTGRSVPTYRIVMSLGVTIVTLVALVVLIYSGVYSSIVAIGRNPLAQVAVLKALARVVVIAGLLLILALAFIYLLLS
jgi:hypothetical protein